jgi:hypothetical protein
MSCKEVSREVTEWINQAHVTEKCRFPMRAEVNDRLP